MGWQLPFQPFGWHHGWIGLVLRGFFEVIERIYKSTNKYAGKSGSKAQDHEGSTAENHPPFSGGSDGRKGHFSCHDGHVLHVLAAWRVGCLSGLALWGGLGIHRSSLGRHVAGGVIIVDEQPYILVFHIIWENDIWSQKRYHWYLCLLQSKNVKTIPQNDTLREHNKKACAVCSTTMSADALSSSEVSMRECPRKRSKISRKVWQRVFQWSGVISRNNLNKRKETNTDIRKNSDGESRQMTGSVFRS